MWMIIGSCLGIFYQTLQKPQMREKAMLLLKKYHPNKTKQNEVKSWLKRKVETDMKQTNKIKPGRMKIYTKMEERQIWKWFKSES